MHVLCRNSSLLYSIITEIERQFVALYLCLHTESNNDKLPDCLRISLEVLRYLHRFNWFTFPLLIWKQIVIVSSVKMSACPLTVNLLNTNASTKIDTSVSPSQAFSHFSSSNYLSYWFHLAPGLQTQGARPLINPNFITLGVT